MNIVIDGWDIVIGASRISILLILVVVVAVAIFMGGYVSERRAAKAAEKWIEKYRKLLENMLADEFQQYPWMSQQFADLLYMFDEEIANDLKWKKHPAKKASEEVSNIAKEKRAIQRNEKRLEYQINFYESMFPWLEDFKTIPVPDAVEYVHGVSEDAEYVRKWLSPEEYMKLSNTDKNQLALDRYMKRKKSDWDIGIEYERYIGYLYEKDGFRVVYNGAMQGLSDMGRDIIAHKGKETLVIQCKRWAREKEIHEKHIFQLYGSAVLMSLENNAPCRGVFVTSAHLSTLARKCADFLGLESIEGKEYNSFPMIKCNISKDGEKIYHLPFDQQYDRIQISGKEGAMFAWTVSEAELNGFRRAHRWKPEQST